MVRAAVSTNETHAKQKNSTTLLFFIKAWTILAECWQFCRLCGKFVIFAFCCFHLLVPLDDRHIVLRMHKLRSTTLERYALHLRVMFLCCTRLSLYGKS